MMNFPYFRRFLSQLFNLEYLSTLGIRVIVLCLGLTTTIITSRLLGADGRGEYYFIVTLSMILSQFANLGMPNSNIYFVTQNHQKLPALLANSFWISLVLGTSVSLLTLFFWKFLNAKDELKSIVTIVLLTPALLFYSITVNLLIGIDKIKAYNLCQFFNGIFIALLVILAILIRKNVQNVLIFTVFSWIISNLFILYFIKSFKYKLKIKFDFKIFKEGIHYSLKSYIITILAMLVLRLNVIFLKIYSGDAEVGYYSVALQICDALLIIPTTFVALLFPKLLKSKNLNWLKTKESLLIMSIVTLLLCLLVGVLAKPFIYLLFGHEYLPSVYVLYCLLPNVFFYSLLSVISQYLGSIGIPKVQILNWVLGLLMLAALNFYVMPKSAMGVSWSLSITHAFLFFLMMLLACFYQKKHLLEVGK